MSSTDHRSPRPAPEDAPDHVEVAYQRWNDEAFEILLTIRAHQLRANQQRLYHSFGRTASVVLGVLAPAVVALQTQNLIPEYALLFGISAILITALGGIVAGLQAAFRWGEAYARSTMIIIQLWELHDDLDTAAETIYTGDDPDDIKVVQLLDCARRVQAGLRDIRRRYLEAEVEFVTRKEAAEAAQT